MPVNLFADELGSSDPVLFLEDSHDTLIPEPELDISILNQKLEYIISLLEEKKNKKFFGIF